MGKKYQLVMISLAMMFFLGQELKAQYTGGIGSGYASFSSGCFVPAPTPSYDQPFCEGGDLQLYASTVAAATYSWSGPGGFSSNEQNPLVTAASSGTYVVVANIAGCGSSVQVELEVVATPSVVPSVVIHAIPGSSICSGDEVTFVATINNGGATPTYQWYVNDVLQSGQSAQSFVSSTLNNGDYVQAYLFSSATCANPYPALSNVVTMTVGDAVVEVSVEALPDETICAGSVLQLNAISESGGTSPQYQWFKNNVEETGATSSSYSPISFLSGDQFSVRLTSSLACISGPNPVTSAPVTININPLPTVFEVQGGGSYCPEGASGVEITLSGSETNVDYQLFDGTSLVGNIVNGTGSQISFGTIANAATYQVVAHNTLTACETTMNGSAVVTVETAPLVFSVTGGGYYCQGGDGVSIDLDGSQNGITYELYLDNNPTGNTITGTSNSISFGNQTIAGTYTVVASNGGLGCQSTMNGSAVISINPLPDIFSLNEGDSYCSGGAGIEIVLSGSEIGINYQLYFDSNTIGELIPGSGDELSFGLYTQEGDYTVTAINPITLCSVQMNGTASVSILPLPQVFSVTMTGENVICLGQTGPEIGLNGSETGISYILNVNNNPVGDPVQGTGTAISFGTQNTDGTYTVTAINSNTLCIASMTGSAQVIVLDTPQAFDVTGGGAYCEDGTGVSILLSGSAIQVSYELYLNSNPTGIALIGNGSPLEFTNVLGAGTYTVIASDAGSGCTSLMNGTAEVIINALPIADAGQDQTIPYNTSAQLNAANGGPDTYSYEWTPAALLVDPNIQNPVTINLTETTLFTVVVTNLTTLCQNTAQVNITVLDPVPTFTLTMSINGQGTTEPAAGPHVYNENTEVTMTATPEQGWAFEKWVVNGTDNTSNPLVITMTEDFAVEAVFVQLPTFELTVSVVGEGTTDPAVGIHTFAQNTDVLLTATPSTGWIFEKWVINGIDVTENPYTLTITENSSAEAVFVEEGTIYTLTVQMVGQGTVTPEPGEHEYLSGTEVTLTATPATDFEFDKWTINGVDNTEPEVVITMTEDVLAIANFKPVSIVENQEISWKIFPNPVQDKLFVEINITNATGSIQIIDNRGQLVRNINIVNNDNVYEIETANLPKGVYYLRVNDGKKQYTKGFIKN